MIGDCAGAEHLSSIGRRYTYLCITSRTLVAKNHPCFFDLPAGADAGLESVEAAFSPPCKAMDDGQHAESKKNERAWSFAQAPLHFMKQCNTPLCVLFMMILGSGCNPKHHHRRIISSRKAHMAVYRHNAKTPEADQPANPTQPHQAKKQLP